ncbi:hypothetical protein HK103_006608 [Boothiomyces macroporosus]|uniref:Protein kinase domain-containing protein n=1 Tax=Boothiomyces macroporosus TaxID=261099 RepID=A0AAD5Y4K5_9FUNG|nr:hypothetical protein HK103_006608 [Boothiomyces macroporosus]
MHKSKSLLSTSLKIHTDQITNDDFGRKPIANKPSISALGTSLKQPELEKVELKQVHSTPEFAIEDRPQFRTGFRLSRQPSVSTSPFNALSWSPSHVQIKRKASFSTQTPSTPSSINPSPAASFISSFNRASVCSLDDDDDEDFTVGDDIGDYKLLRAIGKGAYSQVFEAEIIKKADSPSTEITPHNNNFSSETFGKPLTQETPTTIQSHNADEKVAVKIIPKPEDAELETQFQGRFTLGDQEEEEKCTYLKKIDRETALWSRLSHPHILQMTDMIQLDTHTIIVSELADCTLLDYIKKNGTPGLEKSLAKKFFRQLCSAIAYLHLQVGIIHHDIKLENILLSKENIKLADFGLSEEIIPLLPGLDHQVLDSQDHPSDCQGFCCSMYNPNSDQFRISLPRRINKEYSINTGSLHYLAPEGLRPPPVDALSLPKFPKPHCDMWALGCVLYALLTGTLPFNDSFLPRLQMQILNAKYNLDKIEGRDEREVIQGLLEKNADERWDIQRVLNSRYLQD